MWVGRGELLSLMGAEQVMDGLTVVCFSFDEFRTYESHVWKMPHHGFTFLGFKKSPKSKLIINSDFLRLNKILLIPKCHSG